MPKKSTAKKVLTFDEASKIAKRRADRRRAPARVAAAAKALLGEVSSGSLLADGRTGASIGGALQLSSAVFAGPLELAEAERDGSERVQAAAVTDPLVHEQVQLIVPVDGLVKLYPRVLLIVGIRALLDDAGSSSHFESDLELATYLAPLFWNICHHVGGAKTIREADCSVLRAAANVLFADDDETRQKLAPPAGRRRARRR